MRNRDIREVKTREYTEYKRCMFKPTGEQMTKSFSPPSTQKKETGLLESNKTDTIICTSINNQVELREGKISKNNEPEEVGKEPKFLAFLAEIQEPRNPFLTPTQIR